MHHQEGDILLHTFFIKKKRFRVLLNFDSIIWERETNDTGNVKTTIPASDIIAVQRSKDRPNEVNGLAASDVSCSSTTPGSTPSSSSSKKRIEHFFMIHYAKRVIKSLKDCNRWRKQTVVFYSSDACAISQWYSTVQKMVNEQNRLRNVLVFINPFCGEKRGLVTYEKYCKPLFQLAKIDASCIISQRANQIHDIMMTHNMEQYDAVCCVGGDGTFAELVNGLIFRTMKDLNLDVLKPKFIPKPKIPIGVIPAGSTDTVAFSLHGTHDVVTAAIHMVLGQKRGLDICSVENPNGLIRFCASVMSYGYLGDIALQSEKYRWMGKKRYEYTGIRNFLTNTGYPAEIKILISNSDDVENSNKDIEQSSSSQEIDDKKCFANCDRCLSSSFLVNEVYRINSLTHCNAEEDTSANTSMSSRMDNVIEANTTNKLNKTCDNNIKKMDSDSVKEKYDVFYQNSYDSNAETEEKPSANQPTWKSVKGGFFMISGTNITCACSRSPNGMSKYCHLGDGSIDLILVHKTTFLNNIRLLIKMVNRNGDIRDLPFVEVYRTKKFSFRAFQTEEFAWDGSCHPINDDTHSKTSQWNCDGEIVHALEIVMSSHCQLLDVFMRGPYPFHKEMTHNSCCAGFCKP